MASPVSSCPQNPSETEIWTEIWTARSELFLVRYKVVGENQHSISDIEEEDTYNFREMAKEGEKEQVKLLGVTLSPFVVRVCIALALKGVDYEFIQENFMHPKSELLLKSNPVHKKVPVLIHIGNPVCESMIIVQYIEEAWGNKEPNLMPKDPYDRAIACFWAAFVDDKLFPSMRAAFFAQGEQLQKEVEVTVTNFLLIEEALRTNDCFAGKPYFGGDEIGLIDIALGSLSAFITGVEKATDSVLIDAVVERIAGSILSIRCSERSDARSDGIYIC